jgi:hypothetical protein
MVEEKKFTVEELVEKTFNIKKKLPRTKCSMNIQRTI